MPEVWRVEKERATPAWHGAECALSEFPAQELRVNIMELGRILAERSARGVSKRQFAALVERVSAIEEQMRQLSQGRGIEKTTGVCGGAARIVRSRIPVWLLESLRRQGASDAVLLCSYPTIEAADLANAWSYVAANKHEIDAAIDAESRIEAEAAQD